MSTSPPLPLLETSKLTCVRDGRTVLSGVDLTLRGGERVALLGNNGAGKSTLLRALAGVETGARGEVRCGGVPLARIDPLERTSVLAWMPQALWRDDHFTVRRFLALRAVGAAAAGVDAMTRVLARLRLEALLDRPLSHLSGGEWGRVRIAKALSQRASVVLLDEPAAGLDLAHVSALRSLLEEETEGGQRAVVVSTHDLAFAAAVATHVLLLAEARVALFEPLEAFCRSDAASRLSGVPVLWHSLSGAGEAAPRWVPHVLL